MRKMHTAILSVVIVIIMITTTIGPVITLASEENEKYVTIVIISKEVDERIANILSTFSSSGLKVSVVVNRINKSISLEEIPKDVETVVGAYGNAFLPLLYDLGLDSIARSHISLSADYANEIMSATVFCSPDLAYNDLLLKDLDNMGFKAALVPDTKYLPSGHAYRIPGLTSRLIILTVNRTLTSLLYTDSVERLEKDLENTILAYLDTADFVILALDVEKLMRYRGNAYLDVINATKNALLKISKFSWIHVTTPDEIASRVQTKEITLGEFKAYDLRNVSLVSTYSESKIPRRKALFPEISMDGITPYDFIKDNSQKVLWTLYRDYVPKEITKYLLLSQDKDLTLNVGKKAYKNYIKIKELLREHYHDLGIAPPEIIASNAPFDGKPLDVMPPDAMGEVPNRVLLDGALDEWKSYTKTSYGNIAIYVSYDIEGNVYVGLKNTSKLTLVIGYDMPPRDVMNASWLIKTPSGALDAGFAYRYIITVEGNHVEFTDVRTKNLAYELTFGRKNNTWEIEIPRYLVEDIIPRSGFTRVLYIAPVLEGHVMKPTYFKLVNITIPSMPVIYCVDPIGDDFGPGTYEYSPRGALDLTMLAYYLAGDFVIINVSFLSSSKDVRPVVDIYFDFEPGLGSFHPMSGPNVEFLSTFNWEIAIRASDDPKATFLRIWLGNMTITSNIYAELRGATLTIIVPSRYLMLPKSTSSIRVAVLVGEYNKSSPWHWQKVDESLGASKTAVSLGIQPNVFDMLAPSVDVQKNLLGSYDPGSRKLARVTGFSPKETIIVNPTPSPTSSPPQSPTSAISPGGPEGQDRGSRYGAVIAIIVILVALILVIVLRRRAS